MSAENDSGPGPADERWSDTMDTQREPPEGLEDRVVAALEQRGLLRPRRTRRWPRMAAAAAVPLLVGLGYLLGSGVGSRSMPGATAESPPEVHALLLYETPDFEPPSAAQARSRFDEYSQWVAVARSRGQFITGEDLATDGGWTLGPTYERATSSQAPHEAVLSGLFVVRGDEDSVLSLAEQLPHLTHGGHVVVQRVLPTDQPPRAD